MQPDPIAPELANIERQIATHRVLYLRATWAGRDGEAEYHEAEVEKLLNQWDDVRCGRKATT